MRSLLPISVLMVAALVLASPAQAQSRFNSQDEYLAYVAECAGLFFTDHAQYEAECTPGADINPPGVSHSRGAVVVTEEEEEEEEEEEVVG